MAQSDALDPDAKLFTSPANAAASLTGRPKLLGIFKQWFDRADPHVIAACQSTIDYLTSELGYTPISISIPLIQKGQLAHTMTILTQISAGCLSLLPPSPNYPRKSNPHIRRRRPHDPLP